MILLLLFYVNYMYFKLNIQQEERVLRRQMRKSQGEGLVEATQENVNRNQVRSQS